MNAVVDPSPPNADSKPADTIAAEIDQANSGLVISINGSSTQAEMVGSSTVIGEYWLFMSWLFNIYKALNYKYYIH